MDLRKTTTIYKAPVLILLVCVVYLPLLVLPFSRSELPDPGFRVSLPAVSRVAKPYFNKYFVCRNCENHQVHAASIAEVEPGKMMAIWYGGTREGSKDVAISAAYLDQGKSVWSRPKKIINREWARDSLNRYIKKLGNPVLMRDADKRLWIFFVSVSVGGWSGSSINYTISNDGGNQWSTARRLVTSPFFNISTLVKGTPVLYRDGSIGLPVYHEFLGRFGELLHIHVNGRINAKSRISYGNRSLQPVIVPTKQHEVVALMRNSSSPHRVLRAISSDSGKSWHRYAPTEVPNPDAAVSAVLVDPKTILMVYNHAESGRRNLSLAISHDKGKTWNRIYTIENDSNVANGEYSYPYMIRDSAGEYHLVYTWNRTGIAYARFNRAWINKQMGKIK